MIPKEVQERIDYLDTYDVDKKLNCFDAFHLYPTELAYPDGYFDSMFFNLVGYNFDTKTKRTIEQRDGLHFHDVNVDIGQIFADGSTFIRFTHKVKIDVYQCVEVFPYQ